MDPSGLTLLVFVSTALLALCLAMLVYDWFLRYRLDVRDRLKQLADTPQQERVFSLFKDLNRRDADGHATNPTWQDWLQQIIEQAGIQCTISTFFGWSIAAGTLFALAGFCCVGWIGLVLAPVGSALPFSALLVRRRTRRRKLARQLPEAFAMISRAVKAGQTVPAALQIIADDFEPPISAEFALCYEQQNLGMSRESALRKLATRSGIMELQIFVVALLVQAKSGGDLVGLLDNLAAMIRKRLKLSERVRALTGEGRMQALVLIVLPIAALVGIIFLSPDYAKALLDRPWLLAATGVAQAAGAFWIRRIVNFEY